MLSVLRNRSGCAASFIFMMLPPKSGRKAVRLRNSATITSLSFLYRDIVAAWISSEETSLTEKHISPAHSVEWIPGFRDRLLAVAAQLQAVKVQTMIAKWEGSIRGAWPGDEYMKMANVQTEMISSLALVSSPALCIHPMLTIILASLEVPFPRLIVICVYHFSSILEW